MLNKLRSYIWREGRQQEPSVRIGLDDSVKNQAVEQNTSMQNASLNGALNATLSGNFNSSNGAFEGPNEELRSFFEANGDRELSKIEVLGVLNLISQAVVRDESVLDLSSVSQSTLHSANSSAFPPNLSNSFSTSNIGDLTSGGSRSRRSTRRPLASGPKRQSAKTIVRSQSGISLRKPAAPVETQSRRRMKPSTSLRDVREHSQPMTGTANDILDMLDSQADTPATPGNGLRRRPVKFSTPKVAPVETPARTAPLKDSSTPAPSAQSTIPGSQAQSSAGIFQKSKDTPSIFTQQPKQASTPKPVTKVPAKPSKQPAHQEPIAPITSMFTPPTLPEIDVEVEMDFEFPEPKAVPVNAADLQNSEKYAQEFVF